MTAVLLAAALLAQEGKIAWERDYDRALSTAKETGKPILVYFSCC